MAKGKDNSEPDFSEFDDWRMKGADGENLYDWESKKLGLEETRATENNIALLTNRAAWNKKISAFEAELNKISDEGMREDKRREFAIHFNKKGLSYIDGFNFSFYDFPCSVFFDFVNFIHVEVSFADAVFKGDISFSNAIFGKGDINFANADFGKGNVSFNKTNFGDSNVSFYNTNFGEGMVRFEGAVFGKGHVWFTGAKFEGGYVSFSYAKFEGEFRFTPRKQEAIFKEASFSDIIVGGNLTIKADFEGEATFRRLDVKGSADFSGSSFKKVPDFRDMKLDRPPEVAGMKVPRPKLKEGRWTQRIYSDGNDDRVDVAKYRKLKSMAIAASDHIKSGEFFAYEMIAKRGVETTGALPLLFNHLYGALSDYGQSYLRPLKAFLYLWMITALLNIWKIFQDLVFVGELDFWQNIGLAFILSFRNIVPFFNSLSRFIPSPNDHKSWFQGAMNRLKAEGVDIDFLTILGMVEQFFGAIFLFLLLLGLRNAFRLK